MFGAKIVKRCPKGHRMELSWRYCPRCTGGRAGAQDAREMSDLTIIAGPDDEAPADATRVVSPAEVSAARRAALPRPAAPPPPPPPLKLQITAGPRAGETITLAPGLYRLGKAPPEGPDAISLAFPGDAYMSKTHAMLVVDAKQIAVTDPGSTNGTHVNGEPTRKAVLTGGEEVRMGETVFRVLRGD